MVSLNIYPTVGLNELIFGQLAKDVRLILGKPLEINKLDNYEIWEYPNIGFSLFFDSKSEKLEQIEVEEAEVFIWGIQLMGESPEFVLETIEKNTEYKIEVIKKPPPVIFYNIEDLGLDFYFEDKKLLTVTARSRNQTGSE
jgi:hypothetical protein